MSGRLMEFESRNNELVVHYSDRLVTLMREVRQLQALGYPVAAKIQHTAGIAQKFYKHGVILKQVLVNSIRKWNEVCLITMDNNC